MSLHRQMVFAISAILPTSCMSGVSLAAIVCQAMDYRKKMLLNETAVKLRVPLIALPTGGREKELSWFFFVNRNMRIFKDPLPGRVKPIAPRLCSNKSHKDDCLKIPRLYSNNSCSTIQSKPKKQRCYIIVTRKGPQSRNEQ